MKPAPASIKRLSDAIVIVVFVGLIWLPTIDFFTGIDVTRPPDENRLPAPRPHLAGWNFGAVQQYLSGAEAYFNDHFGFRKRLIRWCLQWKSRLYRDESGHKVVIGKNGWLYTGELEMIEHFTGLARFTPQQLQSWKELLERRRDWLAARGIKYLFVVTPDKQDIYPENLPDWLQAARPAGCETKLDQFLKYMKENSTVEVVDLRPALLAAKPMAPLYLVNDVHWNALGGFIGGQVVIKAIKQQLPTLPDLSLDNFTWSNAPSSGGDMARIMGTDPAEKNFFIVSPRPGMPQPRIEELPPLDTVWDRHEFCTRVENPTVSDINAVFFHDSFGVAWQPFFGHCFSNIYFMQERREFDTKIIEENHPKIVVNQMLERFFNTLVPEELMAADKLNN